MIAYNFFHYKFGLIKALLERQHYEDANYSKLKHDLNDP